jgi:hypothetical protein
MGLDPNQCSATIRIQQQLAMGLRSGDRIPVDMSFPSPVYTCPDVHPSSYRMDTLPGLFPGVKWTECGTKHSTHLSSGYRKNRAIILWVFTAISKATFYFSNIYIYMYYINFTHE